MNTFLLRVALCFGLLLATLASPLGVAEAASCASSVANQIDCLVNQQMVMNGGGDGFGGGVRLRQTFKPSRKEGLCRVDLLIQKNSAQAGTLTLQISGAGLAVPLARTIPAPAIPQHEARWVTFNFAGCPGGQVLQPGSSYQMDLSAGASMNAYTWINSQGAGGNAAYGDGSGWRNAGGGWVQQSYDYAFKLYLCRTIN
jgi:hypothetical protein